MRFYGNIFKWLEDARYPCVGPHLRLLGFTGLWHPNPHLKLSIFKQLLFYITITFFFSQYIKCLISGDANSLKLILQYAPFHMGIVKSCFFQGYYKDWERLIDYMSSIEREQLVKGDEKLREKIEDYIRRSRRITYFFWALAFFSNISIFTEPYIKNRMTNDTSEYMYIFDGYTPFSRHPPGYYVSLSIQTVLGHIVSAYVVGWDTLVVSIMIFFAGQLRISHIYCSKVIDPKSSVSSHQNIVDCHKFYTALIRYQKKFNGLICPVMFVYLIVITVNVGVCIIEIVQIRDNLATLASSCLFLAACLIQLLIFYWYSNEVTVKSTLVSYGVFGSDWTNTDIKLKREIALLGLTTNKRLAFKAGPFNEMSLSTFIAILRASYSFYTLLNSTIE